MVEARDKLHFELPEELTRQDRARDTMVTALLWGVYLYLWVPLVSLLAWALGFEFAYDVMIRAGGARDLVSIVLQYALVVFLIFGVFAIWSISNRLRFKGLNRRTRRDPVPIKEIAEYFGISQSEAAQFRDNEILHVAIEATGKPVIRSIGLENATDVEQWPNETINIDHHETKKAI